MPPTEQNCFASLVGRLNTKLILPPPLLPCGQKKKKKKTKKKSKKQLRYFSTSRVAVQGNEALFLPILSFYTF